MSENENVENVSPETISRIRERTLRAEKRQLHMRKTHNIIPEIKTIVEEEIPE